jgi:hypothetical protein
MLDSNGHPLAEPCIAAGLALLAMINSSSVDCYVQRFCIRSDSSLFTSTFCVIVELNTRPFSLRPEINMPRATCMDLPRVANLT